MADTTCKKFSEIYPAGGADICNKMFGSSFYYSTDEANSYTMWFFDENNNPNDAVTTARGATVPNTCEVQYLHKTAPGPEPDGMHECHPWRKDACCKSATVTTPDKLKKAYGPEYHWDRCGPLSPACERFFVQEACLYECDVNAGLFRKFNSSIYDSNNPTHNTWQIEGMPIKASYCNAWYQACKNDMFCGSGNYFSCAAAYKVEDTAAKAKAEASAAKADLAMWYGVGIAGIAFVVAMLIFLGYVVKREKEKKPLFAPYQEVNDGTAEVRQSAL